MDVLVVRPAETAMNLRRDTRDLVPDLLKMSEGLTGRRQSLARRRVVGGTSRIRAARASVEASKDLEAASCPSDTRGWTSRP